VDTRSTFYPDTEDVMGWDISERGFQIVLSPAVPTVIREHLGPDVDAFLGGHDLTRQDIGSWIMHTGGPRVLEATQEALGVGPDADGFPGIVCAEPATSLRLRCFASRNRR